VTYGRSRILAALSVLAALAATLAACGGNDDDAGAVATTATATTAAPADRAWERVVAGGDCQCSDGSDFKLLGARGEPEEGRLLLSLLGIPAEDLPALFDANESQIERAGVKLLTYVGPGEKHNVLSDGPFYTETANGEKLVDWVSRLIEGKPVDDVRCQKCRLG
jgi:hypothetical protein